MFKSNVVPGERGARAGLGFLLLASPLLELNTYPINLLGIVLLATAFSGFCPVYRLLGRGSESHARPSLRPVDTSHPA